MMHSERAALLIALVATARLAGAQSDPRVGLVLGTHGPGILWNVSNGVAVRPDFSVSVTSSSGLNLWSYGAGLSGLFYLAEHDNLRSYVGPRLGYTYTGDSQLHTSIYSAGAFYGVQYAVVRRLAVFGEVAVTYSETHGTRVTVGNITEENPAAHNVAVGSGVGLVY